jgi:YHS domain-containing protein
MARKLNRSRKRSSLKKRQRRASIVFSTIGVGFVLLVGFLSFEVYLKKDLQMKKFHKSYKDIEVPSSMVCMWEDKIRINPTIPIKIDSSMYYACCEKCLLRIQSNFNNTQIAVDPYTGAKVQKSDAFIRLESITKGDVLYFESQENYLKFSDIK